LAEVPPKWLFRVVFDESGGDVGRNIERGVHGVGPGWHAPKTDLEPI
jgi:hypothetical protein